MPRQAAFLATKWKLDDVIGGKLQGLGGVRRDLEEEIGKFELLRQALPRLDGKGVNDALEAYCRIYELRARINSYSEMLYSQDTRNQDSKVIVDQASDTWADTENRTMFFKLWWIGLPDDRAAALRPADGDHAYFLDTLRRLKPHTLEEKVEQTINLKNATGNWQWIHHYDHLTSAFTFVLSFEGRGKKARKTRPKKLVSSEVARLFASPDAATRKAAYVAYLTKFEENADVLGDVYRTIVRDWRNEYVKLRKYGRAIAPRNLENEVSDSAVSTLLAACRRNAVVFQDFFALKAKMMGWRRINRYHIYAPLRRKEKKVTFAESMKKVMEAFEAFDGRFASLAKNVFASNHVDVYPGVGKRSGAYCMSVTPDLVPYILLNFAGTPRDMYTIAHESGHAIHSQLASGHSMLTFQPTLVLAETASVFGEMILFDRMMGEERNPEVKKGVLLDKISSMYATIGRQAYFVVFEMDAHEAVDHGEKVDGLGSIYLKNLKEQFGNRVEVPDSFEWEWAAIPHIYHTPFYCYAYAFGNLLSLALYQRYREEGGDFVPKYLRLLSHGGSRSPKEILEEVGVDIERGAFWDGGFKVIRGMASELRAL